MNPGRISGNDRTLRWRQAARKTREGCHGNEDMSLFQRQNELERARGRTRRGVADIIENERFAESRAGSRISNSTGGDPRHRSKRWRYRTGNAYLPDTGRQITGYIAEKLPVNLPLSAEGAAAVVSESGSGRQTPGVSGDRDSSPGGRACAAACPGLVELKFEACRRKGCGAGRRNIDLNLGVGVTVVNGSERPLESDAILVVFQGGFDDAGWNDKGFRYVPLLVDQGDGLGGVDVAQKQILVCGKGSLSGNGSESSLASISVAGRRSELSCLYRVAH